MNKRMTRKECISVFRCVSASPVLNSFTMVTLADVPIPTLVIDRMDVMEDTITHSP